MKTGPDYPRVVVGMSGGVDSSVTALLLRERGWDVHGLFMTNWEEDEEGYCNAARDYQDARAVCESLGIPLHRVNFAKQYRERVFSYLIDEYRAGRTPNPDVLCNREIKFGAFAEYARRLGARKLATGHYARVSEDGERLLMATDQAKDQTYFLHGIDGRQLAETMFPLGDLHKSEVREIAARHGLENHAKPDSTGICFIGERPFREFLGRYLPDAPGDIVTETGEVVGRHQGLIFYTIGQRQGLGIGGRSDAGDAPWYVAGKRHDQNELLVVQGHDHPLLMSQALIAEAPHWIAGEPGELPLDCQARTRHRQALQDCHLVPDQGRLLVTFSQPQRAITPGQFVVYYRDGECLGGSVIQAAVSNAPGDRHASGSSLTAA